MSDVLVLLLAILIVLFVAGALWLLTNDAPFVVNESEFTKDGILYKRARRRR